MATNGNNPNEAYWESQHHQQQQLHHHHLQHQQQFMNAPPEGPPLPAASNSFFHPNAPGDHHPHLQHHASVHGMNYGHPSQLPPPPPGDNNFTVLSDAYGNFYKVYHQPNNNVASEDVNPPGGKCEYELFSNNNNFMRPAPGFGFLFHTPQQQQQPPQQTQSLPAVQNEASRPEPTTSSSSSSGTSMLINQLVGNWAPTISGTYSPFGGGGPSLLAEGLPRSSESSFVPPSAAAVAAPAPAPPHTPPKQPSPVHQPKAPEAPLPEASPVEPQLPQAPPPLPAEPQQLANPIAAPTPAVATQNYNKMNDEKSAKLNANVKKQRIVAEVKPMRMSYSDVLSKNVVPPQVNPASGSSAPSVSVGGTKTTGSGHSSNGYGTKSSGKTDKGQTKKSAGLPAEKKVERGGATNGQQKKPMQPTGTAQSHLDGTKSGAVQNGLDKGTSAAKKLDKSATKIIKNRNASGSGDASGGKKNRPRNFNDAYTVQDVQGPSKEQPEPLQDEDLDDDEDEEENSEEYEDDSPAPASSSQQPTFLYNVKKNHNPNDTHIEKISGGAGGKSSLSGGYKRAGRSAGRTKPDKPSSSSSATAAGSSTSGNKRSARPRKNQKYAFVQKLLNAWIEYTVIVLLWLWSLVSDVVYLSLRLCWDYLVAGYQYCEQRVMNLRQEFQQNQPGTWFKGVWKSIDNRFAKESKWAFWRGKRKASAATNEDNSTTTRNYYKDGRLPSTADEAMSSLLNCKGKDAYSILGVSPDCSQEQIRKHYKKIAVLVHPDKNKQPGAEEAFKVLQRSFELIGEPENRKAYDQSLAEALNAEKAWSEINDLLTQLHTKISEAANTIRCSSCCLRHPRKPTGRPHYAARECNSCKIRHSAREGDIWAETSFFGLRWKYLAMMEGNVYDITEWANCQKGALSHLQPNSHIVQYRIVLGGNSQNQQQQQQQQQNLQREQQQAHQNGPGGHHHHHHQGDKDGSNRSRKDGPTSEPNLDDFLNNIYGGQNQQQQQQTQGGSRRRHRRN